MDMPAQALTVEARSPACCAAPLGALPAPRV
eukprot:CAMPEP_0179920298 /NCGR_PEP_ID=MMETSP0983-20121128/4403_1 /TAXON_ID=483367 /ORGANISM="non described non described, Strain CCMP 2436" /LENGTH=30 /DNA_ID= /DNA_START= /DNA_END= /DNA_ORIENTATION=